jgi:probable HAF family extracellular repeat protein
MPDPRSPQCRRAAAAHISALAMACAVQAQSPGITSLGVLPGASSSSATAVSADGQTVVGASGGQAFRWTFANGLLGLGTLGGTESNASAISADGSVVVGSSLNPAGQERAFRWAQGLGMQDLGLPPGATVARAVAVSADGELVLCISDAPGSGVFRWTAAGIQTMPTVQGVPFGMSADGSVIVGAHGGHAFRWTSAAGMQDLGTLGGPESTATAISANGLVVSGWSDALQAWPGLWNKEPFRWTQGHGMASTFLGPVIGPSFCSGDGGKALATSADGSVVVGSAHVVQGAPGKCLCCGGILSIAYVVPPGQGAYSLSAFLQTLGIDPSGWEFTAATAASDDGYSIAGNGSFDGHLRAWIARFPDSTLCYANCDLSTTPPALTIADFSCFLQRFASGDPYANCDDSTTPPTLNVADFACFLTKFAAGCR